MYDSYTKFKSLIFFVCKEYFFHYFSNCCCLTFQINIFCLYAFALNDVEHNLFYYEYYWLICTCIINDIILKIRHQKVQSRH